MEETERSSVLVARVPPPRAPGPVLASLVAGEPPGRVSTVSPVFTVRGRGRPQRACGARRAAVSVQACPLQAAARRPPARVLAAPREEPGSGVRRAGS